MKKNISINISGIIFHIEEDGYEKLNGYLDSINAYFSSYEDSKEIVEDIESRIAEIFLMKLNDAKQIINIEDVESLINTMGTTQDFEATIDADDDFDKSAGSTNHEAEQEAYNEGSDSEEDRKLHKDKKRKLLGGVAAGIARYFSVDPIWIRILLLSLVAFPFVSWPLASISSITLLTYIVLWIVLPGKEFKEDQKIKKLYRDPEGKVFGGVSSGLANYFGIDRVAVRILFVLGIFLGFTGPILYIILWIITPEASSITEKLEMQGEPVTLSTIESNIKKELNEEEGEEKLFVKILLFPFRLIALVIKGISKLLTPFLKFIIEAVRVVFGVFIFALGFLFIISMLIFLISYFGGLADTPILHFDEFHGSAAYLKGVINNSTLIFGSIAGLIPALLLAMLGISIISKRWVLKSYVGWPLLGIWLIGVIGFAVAVPNNIDKFSKRDSFKDVQTFSLLDKKPVLQLNELYDDFSSIRLKLRGHDSDDFKLMVEYESNGQTRRDAIENAKMITYNVELQDSVFLFDSNIQKIKRDYQFRFQNASAIFYIPYNRPFRMDRDLSDILVSTLHLSGYSSYQMDGNDWVFNDEGQLACLTCDQNKSSTRRINANDESKDSKRFSLSNYSGNIQDHNVRDFTSIEANGLFEIEIQQGPDYSVKVKGPKRSIIKTDIYTTGGTLILDYNKGRTWFTRFKKSDKIGVIITVPELDEIDLSGASKVFLRDFKAQELNLDLSGASFLEGDLETTELVIDLTGASKIILRGTAAEMNADLGGASNLRADKMIVDRVTVDTNGASSAYVYGELDLSLDAGGASKIYYSGPGAVSQHRNGAGRIRRD